MPNGEEKRVYKRKSERTKSARALVCPRARASEQMCERRARAPAVDPATVAKKERATAAVATAAAAARLRSLFGNRVRSASRFHPTAVAWHERETCESLLIRLFSVSTCSLFFFCFQLIWLLIIGDDNLKNCALAVGRVSSDLNVADCDRMFVRAHVYSRLIHAMAHFCPVIDEDSSARARARGARAANARAKRICSSHFGGARAPRSATAVASKKALAREIGDCRVSSRRHRAHALANTRVQRARRIWPFSFWRSRAHFSFATAALSRFLLVLGALARAKNILFARRTACNQIITIICEHSESSDATRPARFMLLIKLFGDREHQSDRKNAGQQRFAAIHPAAASTTTATMAKTNEPINLHMNAGDEAAACGDKTRKPP